MANPRQRRKAKSGSHKPVVQSRNARRNLKKQKPIRGPKALQDAWDRHKTVRQNYAALGLAQNFPVSSAPAQTPAPAAGSSTAVKAAPSSEIPRGFGKIIRDEAGNVVRVELNEPDLDEDERMDEDGEVALAPGNGVVRALEELASKDSKRQRHASKGELALMTALKAAHGTDYEAMARDRRRNEWQWTAGQIQRSMRKCGLVD